MSADISLLLDLGFGDAGKGRTCAYLAQASLAPLGVRWSGGSQAAHNVVTPDSIWHCFAQFASCMFEPNAETLHGPGMLVNLLALEAEAEVLAKKGVEDPLHRVIIDPDCRLITPLHRDVGRMRELARSRRHGSCGLGVGEAVRDANAGLALRVRDLLSGQEGERLLHRHIQQKLEEGLTLAAEHPTPAMQQLLAQLEQNAVFQDLWDRYLSILQDSGVRVLSAVEVLHHAAFVGRRIVFEGSQGMLLDPDQGFRPHVTKTPMSFAAAESLLKQAGLGSTERLGILRAYSHRHGAGPFVMEDESLRAYFDDPYNAENPWQGTFRVGWFDVLMAQYAIACAAPLDGLVLTSLDRLTGLEEVRLCRSYLAPTSTKLDQWFTHRPRGDGMSIVTGLKTLELPADEERTQLLMQMQPHEFIRLPGWKGSLSDCRTKADLPREARAFLAQLELLLGLPIVLTSVGPRTDQMFSSR